MLSFRSATASLAGLVVCVAVSSAWAHFPWLAIDEEEHAILFFSEHPSDRDYHLPAAVAEATVQSIAAKGDPIEVTMEIVEKDGFAGKQSEQNLNDVQLRTKFTYGNYHGTLLTYYAKHVPSLTGGKPIDADQAAELEITPQVADDGVAVTVHWRGKPLDGAGVTLLAPEGDPVEKETNADGVAKFKTNAEGLVGFVVGYVDEEAAGEIGGEKYESESHYGTLTVKLVKQPAPAFAPLPEAVSSFGGTVSNGWLYVYSGHTGKEHAHSRENLSTAFRRIRLDGTGVWKELSMGQPLQGLPVVAYDGKVYRVGGLSARNTAGEDADLHSVSTFASYDPATDAWTELADLPEARSSHDAVVIGSKLYVIGGWTLSGDSSGQWLDTAWVYDLAAADAKWESVPTPGFYRRALAATYRDDKLLVVGGMNSEHGISQSVHQFDPATGQWSALADFPGEGMSGFGVSAWNLGGEVYASGSEGVLYRLAPEGDGWQEVAKLDVPRFFHRLLPADEHTLLAVGGASLHDGHLTNVEPLEVAGSSQTEP